MAPNFKKAKAFGESRPIQPPVPLTTEYPDPADLEAGRFQDPLGGGNVRHQASDASLDEYQG